MEYDAVVLAGGRARRFGGIDKVLIEIGGSPLIATAIAATFGARTTVIVGPERPGFEGAVWVQEEPPHSGPVSALSAGLAPGSAPLVAVLAADLPFVTVDVVEQLAAAVGGNDGAIGVDASGRDQYLLAVYRRHALKGVLDAPASSTGAALRDAVRSLRLVRVREDAASSDCDTPDDVTAARRLTGEGKGVRGVD